MDNVGCLLGQQAGDVLEVEVKNRGSAWGRWVKVRVLICVSKPLIQGCWMNIASGNKVWIAFKFEKLIDMCFVCGCLNHMEIGCPKLIGLQLVGKEILRPCEKGI